MFGTPITIPFTQRGLLTRDGKFDGILMPGRHKISDYGKRASVQFLNVSSTFEDKALIEALEREAPKLAEKHLQIIRTIANQVAIITHRNRVHDIAGPDTTRAYWRDAGPYEVQLLDVTNSPKIEAQHIQTYAKFLHTARIAMTTVPAGYKGLAYINGALREELAPGQHAYWNPNQTVELRMVDMRRQTSEVTAQEIMTADRVSVRVTLTAFWTVKDPVKASEAKDLGDQIYRHIQFAIRGAVASRSLDELLNARGEIDTELTNAVRAMGAFDDLGVEIETVGLKDVILPGEMREILNKVVAAEKQAQANLIYRQEETASTRSLLNTARLMENNPLLLRMKEMETLEKITEKIGRLDVTTSASGEGLGALMNNLVSLASKPLPKDDD